MRVPYRCVMLICLGSLTCSGQQPAPDKTPNTSSSSVIATGAVNGHVYLMDTKAPGRKATVYLQPVASLLADGPPGSGRGEDHGFTISLETTFDGSYSFTHVPFGSYYVVALHPGYVSPYKSLAVAEARSSPQDPEFPGPRQKAARELVLKSLPRVDVQSNLPVSMDVALERGGAVSGTVTYDDGTPATGVRVSALIRSSEAEKESWVPIEGAMEQIREPQESDDRGNYRISGLPAGKYIVLAGLSASRSISYRSAKGGSTSSSNDILSNLTVYSGSTPRMKDASSFSIDLGEERSGEDIRIPMSKLHTVSGNFVSAKDGHVVNSGGAVLLNPDDRSFLALASATEDDPRFVFYFVFEGDYILSSGASADVDYIPTPRPPSDIPEPPRYEAKIRHLYGAVSQSIHVDGDMERVTIAVPEPTPQEAQAFKAMQEQEQRNQTVAPKD
jgi:hypothetical protein